MKHLSDQELMRIVQAGDFSPASEIFDRYSSRIYNFAYRFLKNSEAAEDAMQEVFVKMLKHANQFHGDAKLSTWLFSITANWCRDYLRKADNKAKDSDDVLVTLPAPAEHSPEPFVKKPRGSRADRPPRRNCAGKRFAVKWSWKKGKGFRQWS